MYTVDSLAMVIQMKNIAVKNNFPFVKLVTMSAVKAWLMINESDQKQRFSFFCGHS